MTGGEAIVARARGWIGTPYCHRASMRGAGCDCLGLIRGLWRETHGAEPAYLPPYSPLWAEAGREETLWATMTRHLCAVPPGVPLLAGQVLLFRMRARGVAKHLGLVSRAGAGARFIHAYELHGVIESPLSGPWARRVVARFDLI